MKFRLPFATRTHRIDRRTLLSKRQQFLLVVLALGSGLILTQLVPPEFRIPMVTVLSIAAYIGSAFALRNDLAGIEWLTLLTLPTLFTGAVASFYFLLPVRWLTRVPVVLMYMMLMYFVLLTENIYNVAVNRTIALLRPAHTAGFLISLLSFFFITQTILAFRFPYALNAFLVAVVTFLLSFQLLWAMELSPIADTRVWHISWVITIVLAQLVWMFAFLPTATTLQALLFTTMFYGMVGMGQQYLMEKLYKKTVTEFFVVCTVVFLIVLFATHWRGNI